MEDKIAYEELTVEDVCREALDGEFNGVIGASGKPWLVGEYPTRLNHAVRYMELVLDTDDVPYTIIVANGRKRAVAASELANYTAKFYRFNDLNDPDLEFSPDLALLFGCLCKHEIKNLDGRPLPSKEVGNNIILGEVANDFVALLRSEALKLDTRTKMEAWKRNPDKNRDSLRALVEALFKRKSRLLVVRVDLLYRKTIVQEEDLEQINARFRAAAAKADTNSFWGLDIKRTPENPARIDGVTARSDFKAFMGHIERNPVFEHLEGYVWKMEWSRWSGFHYHCVFFFDGEDVRNDVYRAMQICKHWVKVTDGRGFAHNCNQDRRKYRADGIGMVSRKDSPKRIALDKALCYLVKRDQYVRVKPTAKCRVFQTAGRKRKKAPKAASVRRTTKKSTT
ncbi:YagK/YfjJ domain-containing protein [Pandoraea bronchicola]|uniref:YagK/YfjJ C-terminal domain-containing protein n=1 Tax=Pandoraea bronchicola TaxID=2508287 RepID=A0A5E5BWN1_9BURK|nr:inovirus-type Gp2 protein [Pandoraea bronchicola]VVE89878.1 hypothetical protein PBR20603_03851 [Pandoraea bronchicola]